MLTVGVRASREGVARDFDHNRGKQDRSRFTPSFPRGGRGLLQEDGSPVLRGEREVEPGRGPPLQRHSEALASGINQ